MVMVETNILKLINKTVFVIGALLSLIASIAGILGVWYTERIILMMTVALLFFVLFTTILLDQPPPLSKVAVFSLIMFISGSFGAFVSMIEAYLFDPMYPYMAFARISLISASFILLGGFAFLYETITVKMPLKYTLWFSLIVFGVFGLFISSVLAYFAYLWESQIVSLVTSCIFVVGAGVNLTV